VNSRYTKKKTNNYTMILIFVKFKKFIYGYYSKPNLINFIKLIYLNL